MAFRRVEKTVYTSKLALSVGIRELRVMATVNDDDEIVGSVFTFCKADSVEHIGEELIYPTQWFKPNEYTLTREESVKKAEHERERRIGHCKNRIKKLEGMVFQ